MEFTSDSENSNHTAHASPAAVVFCRSCYTSDTVTGMRASASSPREGGEEAKTQTMAQNSDRNRKWKVELEVRGLTCK